MNSTANYSYQGDGVILLLIQGASRLTIQIMSSESVKSQ